MLKAFIIRLCLLIFVTALVVLGFWPVAAGLVFLISLRYNAYEYVFVGFFVDVYYAATLGTFWYTIVFLLLLFAGMYLRPYLRNVSQTRE
jgi:hypothetical protein